MPDFPYYPYYDESTGLTWLDSETVKGPDFVPSDSTGSSSSSSSSSSSNVITTPSSSTAGTGKNTRKSFFSIVPRDNNVTLEKALRLRVVLEDGVEVEPDISFKTTDLAGPYKIFQNFSGYHDKFTVTIMIHQDDVVDVRYKQGKGTWDLFEKQFMNSVGGTTNGIADSYYDVKVTTLLNYWIKKGVPFYIHTDAVGIYKKHSYMVIQQKKRTQNYRDGYVLWDLTFMRWKNIPALKFVKTTAGVKDALKSPKQRLIEARTKARKELAKCNYKKIVFSKKKKKVNCVKKMQQVLYLQKFLTKKQVDGWYGPDTKKAVKKYQKKWSKTFGLKVTGNCNKHTWTVMCGKGKKVKSATNTKNSKTIINVNADKDMINQKVTNDLGTSKPVKVTIRKAAKAKKFVAQSDVVAKKLTIKDAKKVKVKGKSTKVSTKSKKGKKNK